MCKAAISRCVCTSHEIALAAVSLVWHCRTNVPMIAALAAIVASSNLHIIPVMNQRLGQIQPLDIYIINASQRSRVFLLHQREFYPSWCRRRLLTVLEALQQFGFRNILQPTRQRGKIPGARCITQPFVGSLELCQPQSQTRNQPPQVGHRCCIMFTFPHKHPPLSCRWR